MAPDEAWNRKNLLSPVVLSVSLALPQAGAANTWTPTGSPAQART